MTSASMARRFSPEVARLASWGDGRGPWSTIGTAANRRSGVPWRVTAAGCPHVGRSDLARRGLGGGTGPACLSGQAEETPVARGSACRTVTGEELTPCGELDIVAEPATGRAA